MRAGLNAALGTGGVAALVASAALVVSATTGGGAAAAPVWAQGTTTSTATTTAPPTPGPTVNVDGPANGAVVDREPTYVVTWQDKGLRAIECSFDDAGWQPCGETGSAFRAEVRPGLGIGRHTLSVRGVNFRGTPGAVVTRVWTLRDVGCEDATEAFEAVKRRMRAAKERVYEARQAHDPQAVQRAIAHKRDVRQDRIAAKAAYREACSSR